MCRKTRIFSFIEVERWEGTFHVVCAPLVRLHNQLQRRALLNDSEDLYSSPTNQSIRRIESELKMSSALSTAEGSQPQSVEAVQLSVQSNLNFVLNAYHVLGELVKTQKMLHDEQERSAGYREEVGSN